MGTSSRNWDYAYLTNLVPENLVSIARTNTCPLRARTTMD